MSDIEVLRRQAVRAWLLHSLAVVDSLLGADSGAKLLKDLYEVGDRIVALGDRVADRPGDDETLGDLATIDRLVTALDEVNPPAEVPVLREVRPQRRDETPEDEQLTPEDYREIDDSQADDTDE